MENVEGGRSLAGKIGCGIAIAGFGLAFAGLVTATGRAALYIAAATYSIAPAAVGVSCFVD